MDVYVHDCVCCSCCTYIYLLLHCHCVYVAIITLLILTKFQPFLQLLLRKFLVFTICEISSIDFIFAVSTPSVWYWCIELCSKIAHVCYYGNWMSTKSKLISSELLQFQFVSYWTVHQRVKSQIRACYCRSCHRSFDSRTSFPLFYVFLRPLLICAFCKGMSSIVALNWLCPW